MSNETQIAPIEEENNGFLDLKELHYALKDVSSKIFNLHDIAYLGLTKRQVTGTRNAFASTFAHCRSDNDYMVAILNYCYQNPMFACRFLLGFDALPFQGVILKQLLSHRFIYLLATRGASKSTLLACYALLRAILIPGSQVVIISASFRQSKFIMGYIQRLYDNWPILKMICGKDGPRYSPDSVHMTIGPNSKIVAVPLGQGESIRGLRSNVTLVDEFASLSEEIFQVVILGFGAVSMSPNEKVRSTARLNSDWIGYDNNEKRASNILGNQLVLSGTANFAFNHAYKWFTNYRKIVESKGDKTALNELMSGNLTDKELAKFDYRDFCTLELPYEKLPQGFLDESTILNSKATMAQEFFDMEYKCKWIQDTKGFIPMSLIMKHRDGTVEAGSIAPCVMGIDPARSSANFAIVISKVEEGRARAVYCWSFNEKRLEQEFEMSEQPDLGYYALAALKVLYLIKQFNVQMVVMDQGGGGPAVADILRQPSNYTIPREYSSYPLKDFDDPDASAGSKNILFVENFNNEKNIAYNFKLKRDIENDKFVFSDQSVANASIAIGDVKYDFLHDDYDFLNQEIEAMKREVSIVKAIKTETTVRFDTGKGGHKPNKDRYSACLMSHIAYIMYLEKLGIKEETEEYDSVGALRLENRN